MKKKAVKLFDFEDESQLLVRLKREDNPKVIEFNTCNISLVINYESKKEAIKVFNNFNIKEAVYFKQLLLKSFFIP